MLSVNTVRIIRTFLMGGFWRPGPEKSADFRQRALFGQQRTIVRTEKTAQE